MEDQIRILFAEDNLLDFEMTSMLLRNEISCEITRAEKRSEFVELLSVINPDLVIVDFELVDFNGLDAIKLVKKHDADLQVIVFTGSQSEETAVKCMRAGAVNYILKNNAGLLRFAVKDALKQAANQKEYRQLLQQLTQSEDKFSTYINHAPEGVFIVDKNGKYCDANKAASDVSGYSKEELFQLHLFELLAPETAEKGLAHFEALKSKGEAYEELLILKKDGTKVWWAVKAVALPGERYMGFISDITERKKAELTIQANEKKYRQLVESMKQGLALHEVITNEEGKVVDYRFLEMNESFCALTGIDKAKSIGRTILEILPKTEPFWIETYGRVAMHGEVVELVNYAASLGRFYKVNAYSPEKGLFATIVEDVTEERQSEIEIKHLKEDFERVFHATQDGLFLIEVTEENEFRYLRNNLTHQKLTGITQEMIEDKTPVELLGSELGKQVEKNYLRCLTEKEILSYEELIELNGIERLWQTTLYPIEEDGHVRFIVGSALDITHKKIAEDKNKEIAQRLQAITDAAQDGIIMIDDKGLVVFWNKSAEKIFGYTEEEIMGRQLHKMLSPEHYHTEHAKAFQHFIRSGEGGAIGHILVLEGIHKSGRTMPVELALSALNHQGRWMAVGVVRDITERKKAEKDITEGIRLKNLLFSVSNDGIVLFDSHHQVHEANERFCQMLGYEMEEIKELHTWDFEYFMNEAEIKAAFGNMGEVDSVFDSVHVRKDGSIYDVEVNAKGFNYADNWYVVCVCKDITERKNAERDLKQKIDELKRFNKLTVGREMKMIELKQEINALRQQLGIPPKFKVN